MIYFRSRIKTVLWKMEKERMHAEKNGSNEAERARIEAKALKLKRSNNDEDGACIKER